MTPEAATTPDPTRSPSPSAARHTALGLPPPPTGGAPRRLGGLRALLWLRGREWLGPTRDPSRFVLIGLGVFAWFAVVWSGVAIGVAHGTLEPAYIGTVATAAWPLWALIPLLGGGGEVLAAHRLAPYPVAPGSVFGAAWATALLEPPYLIIVPVVLALYGVTGGVFGVLAVVCLVAGASAVGQVAAWVSFLVLAGRRRGALAALVLTGLVVGGLSLVSELAPAAASAGRQLPGGWPEAALSAWASGHRLGAVGWLLGLLAPIPVALLVGPRLTRAGLDREAKAGGVGAKAWGTPGWWVTGSVLRALVGASLRSMTRSVGAQVAVAGVLAVPALVRLPGFEVAQVSLVAMGTTAGVAASVVLGCNAYAFPAGGAGLLLALPVPARLVAAAAGLATFACILLAQVAVTLAGALVLASNRTELAVALLLCLGRSALLAGLGTVWSGWRPAAADFDSLRAKVAPPSSVLSFAAVAAAGCYVLSQGSHTLGLAVGSDPLGAGVLVLFGVVAGAALARLAGNLLDGAGRERVASATHG